MSGDSNFSKGGGDPFSKRIKVIHGRQAPEEALLVGYGAIIEALNLQLPMPAKLALISDKHRQSSNDDWLILTPRHNPADNLYGHLVFALKYEGVNLLFFKKLFESLGDERVKFVISIEPKGQYSRRIWFLFEWLMRRQLDIPDLKDGNYVALIDEEIQYAVSPAVNFARQRIRNNLPGTPDFCPLIFRTSKLERFIEANLSELTHTILNNVHRDVILRASAFLLLKDSKASFSIEGENPTPNRAMRWGKAIGQAGSIQLGEEELLRLQQIVIENSRFVEMGFRTDGGFVGVHDRTSGTPMPEHISAKPEDLPVLLNGLFATASLLEHQNFHPVLAAASIAFGFVFIHPFVDGNGRLHRYLIHHLLAKTKFSPQGIIFPISTAILERIDDYRKSLEQYSHPLLDLIEWTPTANNNVKVLNETIDYYRYFDATKQAEFLFECVDQTVEKIIPKEVEYLQRYDSMKDWLDEEFEMPDKTVALLIRFLEQNNGRLSNRALDREFAELSKEEVEAIEEQFYEIMLKPPLSQYSLAIMPSAAISLEVVEMKQQLRAAIGRSYGSANAEAHISLDGFEADENDYPYILAEYRRIVSELNPFEISFSGFDDFDKANYSAFYIKPTTESSLEIRRRSEAVMKAFDKNLKKQYTRKWADESQKPHMSIGRRLTREWVALAYTTLTAYEAGFLCDTFVIRKFNEKRRQYDVIDVLPLLGTSEPPVQLDLFQP
ncbi:2'-5' RNA ligase family protein [Dyadobacter fanqingshengii]|uniref:Fic family protein n=1 Tax=Dyadobacter fanqingshengii TaxID=2906443 RepID=A0A9X1TA06_9BACT|nr:2'-5' RNA ligase family protein [Dyadobacter fanqingshengii]MCF0041915.1 Fic family protein [Dyadobacter fanqingshengii]USJ36379.1 Fic family protein [Dyadobacter fanqingshengii]